MALDLTVIPNAMRMQQEQQREIWDNAGALAQLVGLKVKQNRVNQMRQLPENERQNFANNSIFAPYLNDTLKADQLAASQAALEQQQAQSKITQANASAYKDMQQGQGYGLENSNKTLTAIQNAISHGASTGNKNAIGYSLDRLFDTGAITPEQYQAELKRLNSFNSTDELKQYATSMLDPKYWNQTEDNKATVDATLSGQQAQKDIAQANREQQLTIENARIKAQQEGGSVQVFGGKAYFIDKLGNATPVSDQNGQQLVDSKTNPQSEEKQRISRVNAVLDEIESILPQSTNSYVGRGLDYLVRGFGGATNGDIAAGKLGTLGGQLVALMPKMSGPQSDKDVAMYKQMAGKLDDPTVPFEVRQAALETIRELNGKYAEMGQSQKQGAGTPFLNAGQQQPENLSKSDQHKLNSILLGR